MLKYLVVALGIIFYLSNYYISTRSLFRISTEAPKKEPPNTEPQRVQIIPRPMSCDCVYNKTLIREFKREIAAMQAALRRLQHSEESIILNVFTVLEHIGNKLDNVPGMLSKRYYSEFRTLRDSLKELLQKEDRLKHNIKIQIRHEESNVRNMSITPKQVNMQRKHYGSLHPASCVRKSGIYTIAVPTYAEPFSAPCDYKTQNGSWLVIQRRDKGLVDFDRNWNEYKHGFGNITSEFWIGLEKIYALTSNEYYELLIILRDFEDVQRYARYDAFEIASESEGYTLKVLGNFTGDAGDSLRPHIDMNFSTHDEDYDNYDEINCAELFAGGWWYNDCVYSNLNGQYLAGLIPNKPSEKGILWPTFHKNYSLKFVEMMIRPKLARFL